MVPASGHFVVLLYCAKWRLCLFREAGEQSNSSLSLSGDIGKKLKTGEMWLLYLKKHKQEHHEHFHLQS